MKVIDNILTAGVLVREMPYCMVFKTTNYCWFKCPHCCECSGPDQPKEFFPISNIRYYLSNAIQDPLFSGNVIFTGGEFMSAYRFGPKNYVPDILNMCLDANMGTDIKTNGGWARTSFGKQIFDDLATITKSHTDNQLQISLSLDNYHTKCMENNLHILETFANRKLPVIVHIASFDDCKSMYRQLIARLRGKHIKVQDAFVLRDDEEMFPIQILNGTVRVFCDTATLFDGGRAANLPNAKHTEFSQFSFLSSDHIVLMAFDSFGRVTLGENSGRKISTKWAAYKNHIYTLKAIRSKLVNNARYEELRAILLQRWKPVKFL